MRRIGVVIGLTSNDMLWETLGQLLDNVSDIVLEHVDGESALHEALRSHKTDVIILERFHNGQEEPDYPRYFDLRPGLGIIVIDPAGTQCRLVNTICTSRGIPNYYKSSGSLVVSQLLNKSVHSCTRYNAYLTTEQVRQIGDQVIPSESVTEEIPEIDALFVAGLDQAGKRIPTPSSIFRSGAAADLSFDDIGSNIPFTEVVVERDIRALQNQQ